MTTRAIPFVAEQLYYSLVNSIELAIPRIVVKAALSAVALLSSDGGHA
jgi:hypothetical protein